MTGLFIQPSFFPLKVKDCCKTMACKDNIECMKHSACQKHKKSNDCSNDMCNPFTGQCSTCIAIAIITEAVSLPDSKPGIDIKEKFAQQDEYLISHYLADILRPPDMIA